ncbi:MAG: class I SAM-dependent methyltransferase, partial [Lachnospiraceae bacterium]|nr:class I SAM-dependent methyltransferase [Lachnospiraceae bacterium]
MEEYGRFAEVYDLLMEEIPYEDWCGYLTGLLRMHGVADGLVCELGCGTGTMTELLAKAGYDMTGIDSSEDMLQQAIQKREASGLSILYLLQDMREIELYGTMRAFVSVCDTMNYLTEPEDFLEVLKLVNNYLDPGGVFIFDLKTEHFFR